MRKYLLPLVCIIFLSATTILYAAQSLRLQDPNKLRYKSLKFTALKAERVVLNNGMILYILEDHELPLINITAMIRAGSYFDPEGKAGLAELTSMVMRTGGTETMRGSAVDETLETLAINLHISAQMESVSVSFSCLKDNLAKGMNIFSQVMMHPVFAEDKLALAKNLKIEELRRIADDPQQFAFREFNRIFYHGNPRGRLASVRSVGRIERTDLQQFHRHFFNPDQIMMAITGDITQNAAVDLMEKHFGAWQKKGIKEEIPPPAAKLKGGIYHLAKDIPQSVVVTGQFAPAKARADFYPFTVLDFILGSGGFPSHLFQEIRTNQGLAYSTGSFYRARSEYGVFGTYAMTKSQTTGKVASLLLSIVERAKKEPIKSKELTWAKKSINDSFIFSFTSTEQIARQQLMLEFDNLPRDYLIKYQEQIKKVEIQNLRNVAKNYLSSDEKIILVMGKEGVFDQLVSTFGKVEKVNVDND